MDVYAMHMKLPTPRAPVSLTTTRNVFQVKLERQRVTKPKEQVTLAFADTKAREEFLARFKEREEMLARLDPKRTSVKVSLIDQDFRLHSTRSLDMAVEEAEAVFTDET